MPGQPANVRHATRDDEAGLFDLLMALHKDNGLGFPPRAQDVREAIRAATREAVKTGTIIGVIEGENGEIAASVCIALASWWYNRAAFYLDEIWLFVRPEYRARGHYDDDLFQYMIAYRNHIETETGRPWVLGASMISLKRLPAKMRLWSRHARLVGGIYVIDRKAERAVAQAAE